MIVTDAEGNDHSAVALSGVESKGHSFPVVWVLLAGVRVPWPADAVLRRSPKTGGVVVHVPAPDDGNAPPSHPTGAPSAAPSRFHAGSAAVPLRQARAPVLAQTAAALGC